MIQDSKYQPKYINVKYKYTKNVQHKYITKYKYKPDIENICNGALPPLDIMRDIECVGAE